MWKGQRVSVVCTTYRDKGSIRRVIDDFFATGVVDEFVVANNNAEPGTEEEVRKTKARMVYEPRQGFGWGNRKALQEATGDIILMTEVDGTFVAHDIFKFLEYSDDFNIVLGTRTMRAMIWDGANMGLFLKWGNWAVAKLLEVLFGTSQLSDVGCTMRLYKRPALKKIQKYFTVGGSYFLPEMVALAAHKKMPFVEIPVNYRPRVGESQITGSFWKALFVGFKMIGLILQYRIRGLPR